jgi:hypothetical protein
MKAVKIFFGLLAGLFAAAHCVYLPILLVRGSHISSVMGSLAGLCIGAGLSVVLFKSAFKKQTADSE